MGFSCRRYLIVQDDTLCRLAEVKFDRMLRDPASYPLLVFAGQRVRMASAVVELVGRVPTRVIRNTFAILVFDGEGCIDTGKFGKHQLAFTESALAPVSAVSDRHATVVDATTRFVAQGGSWTPSSTLARTINAAALGQLQCRRL